MRPGEERAVSIPASPEVQLLGSAAVVLQGAAALDAYRLMTEGIAAVRRRDCIEPSPRLMATIAALKVASSASSASSDDGRQPAAKSLRSGEVVGLEEVGRLLGVSVRRAAHLAPELGAWRGAIRGRPWQFDLGLVQAYIDAEGKR